MTITPHTCCINSTCPRTPHLPTGARRQGRDKENSHTKSQGESPESPVLLGPQGWGLVVSVCIVFESLSASVLLKKKNYDKNPPSQKKKIAAKRNEEKLKKKRGKKKFFFPPHAPSKPARFPLCKIVFLWGWALLFVARPILINKGS